MFRRIVLAGSTLVIAASALAFMSVASSWKTASALTNCSASSAGWNAAETQLLGLINDFRAQNGVAPLSQSPTLANMAAWMAEDMAAHGGVANAPTHDDWTGRTFSQRASQCGATGSSAENIGWGFGSAQAMFNGWLNSPGHRAAMISSTYQYIGLGQVGTYWAADFSSSTGSGGGGSTQPTNTPVPTQPNGGGGSTVTNTPGSGSSPTGNGTPTASATPTSSAGAGTPIASYKLPSSYPIKRAMIPQISTE